MTKEYRLFRAAEEGDIETAEKLLATGLFGLRKDVDINAKDSSGGTCLISAAAKGHKSLIKLFLAKGADVNVQNNDGNTALILAAEKGHTAVVDSLLAKGADVNVQNNNYGSTALICAASGGTQRLSTACWPRAPR